ncbi:SIMPL domain-containing protein [Rhodococcus sp. IEGM 1379]|uniref:SIMPL domain-containing protein n=1 Tax=Rhodococcus sp. IEGM 1379 TaxID=3047086 RepID=UPI0024B7B384|nr:SIMPL domain-containing protein [Rhodococcus sp. IEGM 1379]MDI9917131.1 SIMPL domain-containing protein [Rhodococcus sp. IEGM 1379]
MPTTRRTVFALLTATAALTVSLTACGSSDSATKEVTVVGTGEVRGAPDILTAGIGVEVVAPDVSGAVSQSNEKARAMIDAMVAAGVAAEDVQTSDLSVQPQYDGNPYGGGNVTGYRATNSVRIIVRQLDKASGVLDAGIAAGGNAARLNTVAFDIDDDSKLLADARTRAFQDAKTRAEQYADLSGTSLSNVVTITEAHNTTGNQDMMRSPSASMSDMMIAPGTQQVSFEVTVTWSLD